MSAQTIHQAYQSLARIADDFSPVLSREHNRALTTISNIFSILRIGKRLRNDVIVADIGRKLATAVAKLDPNREFFTVYTFSCIKQISFCLMLYGTLEFGRTTVHECYHKEILQLLSHSNHISTEKKIVEYYSKKWPLWAMIKSGCGIKEDRPSFDSDARRLGDKFQEMLSDLPFRMYRAKSKSGDLKFWGRVRCLPTNEQIEFLKVDPGEIQDITGFESIEINRTVFKV